MSRNEPGGGSIAVAFFAGAALGAIAALLYAPAAGDETRQFLSDKARESRERALQAAREGRETLKRQKDQLSTAVERGRDAYSKARTGGETA